MYTRILVPTDGSDDSVRAAESAAQLAERFNSQVTLLSVYSPQVMSAPEAGLYEPSEHLIHEIQTDAIKKAAAPFMRKGIGFETRTEVGNTASVILEVAEQQADDLIIIGSHGEGGFRRFLLGSVSDKVSHSAHCAVMIVKREDHS